MLSAPEQCAAGLGFAQLHLDTTVRRVAAQRPYDKNGYREARRGEMPGFECVFYEKLVESVRPARP